MNTPAYPFSILPGCRHADPRRPAEQRRALRKHFAPFRWLATLTRGRRAPAGPCGPRTAPDIASHIQHRMPPSWTDIGSRRNRKPPDHRLGIAGRLGTLQTARTAHHRHHCCAARHSALRTSLGRSEIGRWSIVRPGERRTLYDLSRVDAVKA